MKAIRIHEYGGPEVLRYTDVPDPQISAAEVLVRVRACAFERAFDDHAGDPAFGHLFRAIFAAGLVHRRDDLLLDRQRVGEQRIGADDIELRVFDALKFCFGPSAPR